MVAKLTADFAFRAVHFLVVRRLNVRRTCHDGYAAERFAVPLAIIPWFADLGSLPSGETANLSA